MTKDKDKLGLQDLINPRLEEVEPEGSDLIKLIAIDNLLSKDNLKSNSRIKYSQVTDLTKLNLFAEVFDVPLARSIADNVLELQISINGLGRKELVDLVGKVYNPLDGMEMVGPKRGKDIFR